MIRVKSKGVTVGLKPEAITMVTPVLEGGIPVMGKAEAIVLPVGTVPIDEPVDDIIDKINDELHPGVMEE